MVSRLFASKNSSSQSGQKNSGSQGTAPPPPPASHKPKSPFLSTIGKPPRKRPNNLPLSQPPPQNKQATHRSQYSSKTPPASTFRVPSPLKHHSGRGLACANPLPGQQKLSASPPHPQSTYLSFTEGGPTYSYLDLTRARSDESLLWTAEEEASALVAELRASLNSNSVSSDNNIHVTGKHMPSGTIQEINRKLNPYQFRPESSASSNEAVANRFPTKSPIVPPSPRDTENNPFQRSFSVMKHTSDARVAAQKLNHSPPLRSLSFTDLQSAVELVPLSHGAAGASSKLPVAGATGGPPLRGSFSGSGNLNFSHSGQPDNIQRQMSAPPLKTFGGSWKSLLRGKFLFRFSVTWFSALVHHPSSYTRNLGKEKVSWMKF